MLQPRSFWIAATLLLAAIASGEGEDLLKGSEEGSRLKRETGDVTVLSLEENGRLRDPPVGVLSSTARTFVNNGATTEYATQILGTTVGNTYAKLLSTGSRVFYDSSRPSKDPFLVFPTIPGIIKASKSQIQYQTAEPVTEAQTNQPSLNEIKEDPTTTPRPKNVVSVRKEFSVKKNTEVKPAKVKPNGDLPTVTIKNDFAPSGYSDQIDETTKEPKKPRIGKGLFRGGVQIKNEFQKYDTVTYVGFADFTTTVGNTIIIFMPKTAVGNSGPVTSISGAATLRPEDALNPVVTTVKTFMSHSPGMATKTVTGHNLNMQTSLPTVQADTRASKAYNPIYVTSEQYVTTDQIPTSEHTTPEGSSEFPTEQTTTDHDVQTDSSEPNIPTEEVTPTEALKLGFTYATTKTRVFIPGDEPLGLAKSIAVIQASDSTTTYLTSFLFGTIIDGSYTQLTQVVSSTATPKSITPTPVLNKPIFTAAETTTEDSPSTTEESPSTTESEETTTEQNEDKNPDSGFITKLVPTTVYNTYTYFTTFFIPKGETTSTSIKTREVVSDEIRYVTTQVPKNEKIVPTKHAIYPTEVTESYQTTTPEEAFTTEESPTGSTPQLPSDITTNVNSVTREMTTSEITTVEPTTTEKEEEVEIIIRTLYTTYTYLTTFFQETTSSVRSREVVETNVVTSTLDTNNLPEATDPAVAGLFSTINPTNVVERPPSSQNSEKVEPVEEYKTYTYYTTVFVDGETLIESRTEVVKETISPSTTSKAQFRTALSEENNVVPREFRNADGSDGSVDNKKKPSYDTISRPRFPGSPSSEALVAPRLQSSIDEAYSYDTTMSRIDRITATKPADDDTNEKDVVQARAEELKKEAILAIGLPEDSEYVETMVTDVTSSSSGGNRRKSYDEYDSNPNDQISAESNTEEIEPSFSPTVLLQTSYTTFTYFTTVYKGTSSDIISRLETVTNVVTETVKPTEVETNLSPEEATLPITYFTTFTYWTTLYKGKSTMITSREETVSNVVTPTLSSVSSQSILLTETPSSTKSIEVITPTEAVQIVPVLATQIPTESPTSTTETSADTTPTEPPSEARLDPTTYYTTYTYFTTSYIGNDTVINSHLETETNVVTPTKSAQIETSEVLLSSSIEKIEGEPTSSVSSTPSLQPTGLISTIKTSVVNEGITTLLNTDVYGTYIDGLYAQVLESSSEIVSPSASTQKVEVQPTGVVSINEGKIVDAAGISTTLFTTKAIGTYIDNLYAQVVESTSTVVVDEEKKTVGPVLEPSTTTIGSKVFTTGLVRLIEGSIIKEKDVTTFYESRVIGTIIDGRYAQIIESTSSFKSNQLQTSPINPSSTIPPGSVISPTVTSTAPGPAAIESSLNNDNEDKDEEEDDDGRSKSRLSFTSKKKNFTPVIRPFSSRPRPTFLPKKKTGDPATTITRTSFTPTVTATPASKTGFGSSRNRFAPNRKSSSSAADVRPTTSSSRRYSRPRSSSAPSFGGGSRSRSSTKVQPTVSITTPRRGGFNYRSTGRPSLPNLAVSSSRNRIRPTQASVKVPAASTVAEDINNNDITGAAAVTEEIEANTNVGEEDVPTTTPTTTTESARRANNPLLRFRRPPILQRPSTTTTTSKPSTTPKRSSLLRRPDSRSASINTTPRSRGSSSFNNNNRVKPRPAGSIFPPRGLARKPVHEEVEEKPENVEDDQIDESGDEIQDNEYEGSETAEQTSSTTTEAPKTNRRTKGLNPVQIRPFTRRPRNKRQANEYGTRGYTTRYRRPSSRTSSPDYYYDDYYVTQEPVKPPTRSYPSRSRGQASYQQAQQKLRPSPASSTPRHQFTLRERTPQTTSNPRISNFRRPTTSPRRRVSSELTTVSQRQKSSSRSRNPTTEASFSRGTSRRYSNQRKTTSRTNRYRDNNDFDAYSPQAFDGTITVTHKIPTEVTIPVINGKNTEYKNVITAKPSLEVLGPYQYTSTLGKDGKQTIQLTSEITSALPNGFMEVTKFLVYETPTTSITFTPTTLRGRKTSFSHVVPSTVYEVRQEVSTVQPDLGSAPLANLLLSQLLLGNLGVPNTGGVQTPGTPTTEFKTKTTTYVTTVTSHTSTVLPLTFRGKAITTTIVDSSTQVITATEYLTETIVITPTVVQAPQINNQLNTLLLPALLQAQILGNMPKPKKNQLDLLNDKEEDEPEQRVGKGKEEYEDERPVRESSDDSEQKSRKKGKIKAKEPDKPVPTSVVTLYVSGKHPGEFTTLLSTVVGGDDSSTLRKREINPLDLKYYKIEASRLPELGSSFSEELSSNIITHSLDDVFIESSEMETQSLESVIGDVSKYLTQNVQNESQNQQTATGHFLLKGRAESAPDQRKASTRSTGSSRQKRQVEGEPKRRIIRVRVPVNKAKLVNQDSDVTEATDYNTTPYLNPYVDPTTERNVKRVRVAKKRILEDPSEIPKRRIVVTKIRPIDQTEIEPNTYEEPFDQTQEVPQTKRRRILKTRKRIINQEETETPRRRITITKKRPLQTDQEVQSTPVLDMSTLYDYHYSIPSDKGKASVMVSQVFMSGPEIMNHPNMEEKIREILDEPFTPIGINDESILDYTQPQIVKPVRPTVIRGDVLYKSATKSEENEETTPKEEVFIPEEEITVKPVITESPTTVSTTTEEPEDFESYDQPEYETDDEQFEPTQTPEFEQSEEKEETSENPEFELDPTYVTIFPYDTTDTVSETPEPTTEYSTVTKTLTTTRQRTYTYVVTRVSGNEQIVTSSTSVKPDVKTITVTETVPITQTATANAETGRGLYVVEPRYNLATKVMSNGVEVIVAGDKSTLPGSPQLRVIPSGLAKPITLAPSTLTDHMMMLLPQESQKPHNDFITKTYMTTYTYLTTFAQEGSTVVSSREKVVSNIVTEEVNPSKTRPVDHFTLTSSPELMTGVYHTTYTYLNTLVDGELPLVVTSKKTVSNTVTEQSNLIQPSELPIQDTNTYLSTVAYTKTLSEGDELKVVSTEDVLTQVVITESDYLPSSVLQDIHPTPITTDITKTYFATYTYFKTKVEEGQTVIKTEIATSSDVVTETFTIQPKKTSTDAHNQETKGPDVNEESKPINLFATKTYLTTFTYFTTLLQDNKSPSIVVKSRTKVQQNIVTETVDSGLLDTDYLSLLKSSVSDKHDSIIATATLNNGQKMEITAMTQDIVKPTQSVVETTPSNVITGSTIIFFDENDQIDTSQTQIQPSFTESYANHNLETKTASVSRTTPPSPSSASATQSYSTKHPSDDDDKEELLIPELASNPVSSGSSGSVNNIFNGLNALGPVINAMADLFQTNFNSKTKNESVPRPVFSFQQKPFETKHKEQGTTPRSPVYIPVGVLDSEPSESQHFNGHNLFPDVSQRTKPLSSPNIEAAMLSGGIPISPGQVITTNSDVIIGKHAVHGPRPPVKPFGKDNVEGMKPPPPPAQPKPNWPPRDQDRFPSSHVPQRVPPNPESRFPPKRDHSVTILPPPPPPPIRDHYIPLRDRIPAKVNAPHKNYPEIKLEAPREPNFPYTIDSQKESSHSVNVYAGGNKHKLPQIVSNIDLKNQQDKNINNNHNLKPHNDHQYIKYRPVFKPPKPVKHEEKNDENSQFINISASQQVHKDEKPETPENLFNGPLLVNIQPSQVANVLIPHGVSTALIYNREPEEHSQKGEIFNEPSPYPDVEVGMVGVAGLSNSDQSIPQHAAHIPSNAVRMDVPVSPQGIEPDVLKVPTTSNYEKRRPASGKRPPASFILEHATGLEYMTPPPPPISALVNYHLGHDVIEDQDSESSINSEYHTDGTSEGISVNIPSVSKPKKPFFNERQPIQPTQPFTNYTSGSVQYSVINSKPVVLGYDNTDKQPPIIKGKPGISTFDNNSQATVSVGKPTNLKPTDDVDHPLIVKDKVDVIAPSHKPTPFESNLDSFPPPKQPQPSKPPFDNTVYAMNMDEKVPLPTYETPPQITTYEIPSVTLDESHTPKPIKIDVELDRNSNQNDAVVGLTPPAVTRYPNNDKTTHRPVLSSRRPYPPFRKRPNPPPYKFERPLPTIETRPKIPSPLETERPPLPPVPTEMLSPPKPTENFVQIGNKIKQTTDRSDIKFTTTSHPDSINPILGGSLTVAEHPTKPEVITTESKVVLNNNFRPGSHKNRPKYPDTALLSTKLFSPTRVSQTKSSTQKTALVGSETVYPENPIETSTKSYRPTLEPSTSYKTLINSTPATQFIPSRATKTQSSVIPFLIRNNDTRKYTPRPENSYKTTTERHSVKNIIVSPIPTTHVVTHTQTITLAVTTTESRIVIQTNGQKPSTDTLFVTKTFTSTLIDTVTETHTLVKPTSILSTVTTTMPQATTTIFPTATLKHPEPTVMHEPDIVTGEDHGEDTILVVMTDKDSKHTPAQYDPNEPPLEIEAPIEENEVSPNVLLGGFLSHHSSDNECKPECKATRNERCQKINNVMRCVCRPGFARMFLDRPCKPTYTFSLSIPLERLGPEKINFTPNLLDPNSTAFQTLSEATKEGLDRMIMQSEIRDVYHGLAVTGFQLDNKEDSAMANFYIQLSENTDETRLMEMFKKHLTSNNFSMGGTDLHASKGKIEHLRAEDFDECTDTKFHDCSENAQCFNLRGTYTCSCKEGFTDLSHNTLYPGRVCSAEMIGCQRCNFHGNCYTRNDEEELCECFQWYAGQYCQVNLKVMLLILSLVGISLIVLLIVCLVLSCMRRRPVRKAAAALRPPGFRFRPPRPSADKRAMISLDTSSEASMEHTPPPYIKQVAMNAQRPKPCRKQSKAPSPPLSYHGTMEQRDRSLTVMIPRAKYRPVPVQPTSSMMSMSTFGPEQKLLKYLTIEKPGSRPNSRKPSSSTNQSHEVPSPRKNQMPSPPRKPSTGALVSAGFEVSATVGRTKEIHECYISEPHTDLGQQGFSTIRTADSSIIVDIPPPPTLEAELLDASKIDLLTVSEARSYDETTIHPPTKCLRHYDKHMMSDEGHTMVERDIGSTFVMPQSHLYKRDRGNGSDISNFDSL